MTALDRRDFGIALVAMTVVVVSSNILVQYPFHAWGLQDYFTWGAFTYPFSFLVTELANRRFGPKGARRVVYVGFVLAVILSVILASPRIAIASGSAFLTAQLLDVSIFSRLRDRAWWLPPFASSTISAAVDTMIFFSIAFYCGTLPGTEQTIDGLLSRVGIAGECLALPWVTLALADYGVKLTLSAFSILPYGAVLKLMRPALMQRSAA
ncbi:queuosine precursor transporter [Microvirga sp. 2TAF3]|uniref:queuosine precursor transporter n=1 Tax=Microvirga sp. 2TAF3 TaxID=3233014 RepID=UPI003F9B1909